MQAANTHTVLDDQGGYADWLELHNPTDTPVSLLGYTLTDDPVVPTKWPVPVTTLKPGGFQVIWASGIDRVAAEDWHTSFRLNRTGGYVGLFAPDGQLVDEVSFGPQVADVSLGRLGTASDQWVFFPSPTPGKANTTSPRAPPDAPPVVITPGSGRFAGPVTVQLAAPLPESTVYYTLDGADPTVAGQAVHSTCSARADDGAASGGAARRRASEYRDHGDLPGGERSDPAGHFAGHGPGSSVGQRHRHLHQRASVGRLGTDPRAAGDDAVVVPRGCTGLQCASRAPHPRGRGTAGTGQALVRVVTSGQNYGPQELAYPLFGPQPGQTYTRLVLRAGTQDSWQCRAAPQCVAEAVYVRNQLVRDLHGAMGQVTGRGRWVALYLNGAYWGLYHLTEHLDDTFLAMHFDTSAWYTSAPGGRAGLRQRPPLASVRGLAWNADLSVPAQYEQAIRQLDIESFTAFVILHLWNGDTDWGSHDWLAARRRNGPDPRWRLFLGDASVSPDGYGRPGREARGTLIPILASLLASPQYQAYFTAQVERHLAGALAPEPCGDRLTARAAQLRPAMAAEAARWLPRSGAGMVVAQWEAALQRFADTLDAKARRLRDLSDPVTLRQHLSQLATPATTIVPPPLPPDTRIALLVHHPAELAPGDAAVVAHLEARGATVTVLGTYEDSQHDHVQVAAAHDLLLFSSSLRLIDAAARYTQTTTPLIFWEPRLLEATHIPLAPWGGTRPEQIGHSDCRCGPPDHRGATR